MSVVARVAPNVPSCESFDCCSAVAADRIYEAGINILWWYVCMFPTIEKKLYSIS